MVTVAAVAWALFGGLTAWVHRPRRCRRVPVPRAATPARHRSGSRWATVAAALTCGLIVHPLLGLGASALALAWPGHRRRRAERARAREVALELPDVVDLLRLAASSGLGPRQSLAAVGELGFGRVAATIATIVARFDLGVRFADGLADLESALGDVAAPLVRTLADAAHYGTALAPALDRVSLDLRAGRRRLVEVESRKVPVRLLFPLVFCVLPAFVLLTVVPVVAGSLGSLRA